VAATLGDMSMVNYHTGEHPYARDGVNAIWYYPHVVIGFKSTHIGINLKYIPYVFPVCGARIIWRKWLWVLRIIVFNVLTSATLATVLIDSGLC
jgi:hypothetical protein